MNPQLRDLIRSVPDFPKEGIVFRDITTLLKDPAGLKLAAEELYLAAKSKGVTKVAGIESRGFILGGLLAAKLNAGFVPVRKKGKLPAEKISETYLLEYGSDIIEIHKDAILPGDKVLMHDDLLATGGTMEAACKLIEKLGGEIVQVSFMIELSFLQGRKRLERYDIKSLIDYDFE
ncbi:MAG TPA: adenine phosphoribosyltransferase [Ignavibacteriales bacterium]|nr:adenine phosphoribosyltransferase [Ignavibacteriales bacterium]